MKKFKFWSMILLNVVMLPIMVACSSDDDSDGSGVLSYTEAEIVEMLNGQWAIKGEVSIENPIGGKNKTDYSGTITFEERGGKHYVSSLSSYTLFKSGNKELNLYKFIHTDNKADYYDYKVLRKESKMYLSFYNSFSYSQRLNFQIVALSKTSFKLVLDEIINNEDMNLGHVHMTMISQ